MAINTSIHPHNKNSSECDVVKEHSLIESQTNKQLAAKVKKAKKKALENAPLKPIKPYFPSFLRPETNIFRFEKDQCDLKKETILEESESEEDTFASPFCANSYEEYLLALKKASCAYEICITDLPEKPPLLLRPSSIESASLKSSERCDYIPRLLHRRPSVPKDQIPPKSVVRVSRKPHRSAPRGATKENYALRPNMQAVLEDEGIKSRFTVIGEE